MPDLSVVIVNYNTCDLLRNCLQSLVDSLGLTLEIIVVDNASSDGSSQMVTQEFPTVIMLAQSSNTWFCGGNNIGIDYATAEYVLLLNPDTVVASDALYLMLDFIKSNPSYIGVTAQMHYPDGGIQQTCSKIPTYTSLILNYTPLGWLLPFLKRRINRDLWYNGWERDRSREVEVIPGSCTLMRRDHIGLDDELLLYFPEDTLARKYHKLAYFLADAKIEHHEKSATQTWSATSIFFRDMLVYTRKHHGVIAMMILWLLSRPLYLGMWLKNNKLGNRMNSNRLSQNN